MDHIYESIADLSVNVANTSPGECWQFFIDEEEAPNSIIK